MIDLKEIARGFMNSTKKQFGVENQSIEERAEKRYEICLQCPIISDNKRRCDITKGGCNCLLGWKTRSNSKCPKDKW